MYAIMVNQFSSDVTDGTRIRVCEVEMEEVIYKRTNSYAQRMLRNQKGYFKLGFSNGKKERKCASGCKKKLDRWTDKVICKGHFASKSLVVKVQFKESTSSGL